MTGDIRFSVSALAAKHLFYNKAVVWVEGPSDVFFYKRFEESGPFVIDFAEGKERLRGLADETLEHGLPYVLVFDGEYDVLEAAEITHSQIIRLDRHSMENYLFEGAVIERVCWKYVGGSQGQSLLEDAFGRLLERFNDSLHEVIVLDITRCRSGSECPSLLPEHVESLLLSRSRLTFDAARIEELEQVGHLHLEDAEVSETRARVDEFLDSRRLADICPGHLIFGLARDLLLNAVRRNSGKKPTVDNDTVLVLLSEATWELLPTPDHTALRDRLAEALAEASALVAQSPG